MPLNLKPADQCELDLVSLGECMIRLSPPGHGRIEFAQHLEVSVGGGEYNVAYALARLGLRTGWIGGLNSSPMGAIIRNHARSVGVDVSHVVERDYDGFGTKNRVGLNFTEVGTSKRGSATLYDRAHSATASIKPGEVPTFWGCGVTPQNVVLAARPELCITHAPGHMLITDVAENADEPFTQPYAAAA